MPDTVTKQRMLLKMLGSRPIAFNPQLARMCGSVKAGLFLSQLLYWMDKGENEWFYKTIKEIEEETALSREEQDGAIRKLTQMGLIEVDVRGLPARRHFKIDFVKVANQFVEFTQTSLCKTRKTYTENTTDTPSYRRNDDGKNAISSTSNKKYSCPLNGNSPLKEQYPKGHTECAEYVDQEEKIREQKFINRSKQYAYIHKILRAGYGFNVMNKTITKIEEKNGKGSWDFSTLASWLEKGGGNSGR